MGSLKKIMAKMESTESKKHRLRRAILGLINGWKDLEEHIDSTQHDLHEFHGDLEAKEKHLLSVQESIRESNLELESIRLSVGQRMEVLEQREMEFKAFQEEHMGAFRVIEKRLDLARELAEERIKAVELSEERLAAKQEIVARVFEEFELEQKELEKIQKCVGEKFVEIGLKAEQLKEREEELERRLVEISLIEEKLENRGNTLDEFEICLERRASELDSKEEQLEIKEKQVEQHANELDSRTIQLDSVKKFNRQCFQEFRSKKKQLKIEQELLEERSKELDSKEKQLDSIKEFNQEYLNKFVSKEKQLSLEQRLLEERSKELDSKYKQLTEAKSKSADDLPLDKCSPSDIIFFVRMDGKSLQMFLNERAKNHDSVADEVSKVLRLSSDPAKLILDAMEGFYSQNFRDGNAEFEGSVVRRTCILLLEQLIGISPQIHTHVKDAALKVACEWKAKMKAVVVTSLEVLGFLHLVAAYGLISAFQPHELLSHLELIAHCRQAPKLYRLLGLADRIPDLVQRMRKKKQYSLAIRLVCTFELCEKFSPKSLYEECLKHIREEAEENALDSNKATDERVEALQDLIRCIADHKLESECPPPDVEILIKQLTVQKATGMTKQEDDLTNDVKASHVQQQEKQKPPGHIAISQRQGEKRPWQQQDKKKWPELFSISQQEAQKRPRAFIPAQNSPTTPLISDAYTVRSMQTPLHQGHFREQDGFFRGPTTHYTLEGLTPMVPYFSPSAWPYRPPHINLPFDFAARRFGEGPFMNSPPSISSGNQYIYEHHPWHNHGP